MSKIIEANERFIKAQPGRQVRVSVAEALNAMLDWEANPAHLSNHTRKRAKPEEARSRRPEPGQGKVCH